jgi:hypothetical protein
MRDVRLKPPLRSFRALKACCTGSDRCRRWSDAGRRRRRQGRTDRQITRAKQCVRWNLAIGIGPAITARRAITALPA